ncbi:hypothetical protein NEUTE1DRAFT_111357 [Neurospora tetrasperma FGSC 2508]|uniref:Uncharacterized protein n=1 Tax=Neurospora tetrasperma (strain FGSC 2508 / ATCC MYA-4615 / P0657) TaxID=510951 RepID=F8MNK7_NEUT8|nr:uncharacterized protein NEUTE1DRAFT_111357 [Neurospora tetrasperma FGSC 2508]EGO56975.1 hypothetical protein NEUTE1DRAFT_111357 [Neurospora tetrasperma FGSC 2508]EGZ72576.1 hypothetical protein NEUTE2DRAFT_142290 [Neurospora tetrasperma FGSC 2509]
MSNSTIPNQPKKSISISLSLKISEEDRNYLLEDGGEPLLPLFRKFFEKQESNNTKVDPGEAAIPLSLDISSRIRLLDITRHDWDPQQEDLTSEEESEWEHRHKRWLGHLANALTVIMISHWTSLQDSDSSDSDDNSAAAGTDNAEDEDEAKDKQWEMDALKNAQELGDRLMKEPKRSRSWIKYLGLGVQERTFTGSDFQEPCALAGMAEGFVSYLRKDKVGSKQQRKGLKSLMKALEEDIEECESLEDWLVTSLMLFLGAAEVLRLQENPTRQAAKPVVLFLRNYVASVLLVESVFRGD